MSKEPMKEELKNLLIWMAGRFVFTPEQRYLFRRVIHLIENQLTDEQLFEIKAQEHERGLKDAQPGVGGKFIERWTRVFYDSQMKNEKGGMTWPCIETFEEKKRKLTMMLQEIPVSIKE